MNIALSPKTQVLLEQQMKRGRFSTHDEAVHAALQMLDELRGEPAIALVYVNGVRFRGDPRTAPLTAQALVQVDVGTDVAPQGFTFPPGL